MGFAAPGALRLPLFQRTETLMSSKLSFVNNLLIAVIRWLFSFVKCKRECDQSGNTLTSLGYINSYHNPLHGPGSMQSLMGLVLPGARPLVYR